MNFKNIFFLIILVIMALGLFSIWQKIEDGKRRLAGVEKEVAETIKRKGDLEKEVAQKQSLDYLERQARDQLNLIKSGERIVILPPKDPQTTIESGQPSVVSGELSKELPNWQKWWRLFFD